MKKDYATAVAKVVKRISRSRSSSPPQYVRAVFETHYHINLDYFSVFGDEKFDAADRNIILQEAVAQLMDTDRIDHPSLRMIGLQLMIFGYKHRVEELSIVMLEHLQKNGHVRTYDNLSEQIKRNKMFAWPKFRNDPESNVFAVDCMETDD